MLNRYSDWKDSSYWPESSKVVDRKGKLKNRVTPGENGIVGTFCRTYSVIDVIEKYLKDVYSPCDDPNRYTYIEGSSSVD